MSQRLVHGRIFADRFEGNATSRFRSCACQEKMCSIFIACSIVYSLLSNRPYTIFSSNGARQKKSLKPEFQVIFFFSQPSVADSIFVWQRDSHSICLFFRSRIMSVLRLLRSSTRRRKGVSVPQSGMRKDVVSALSRNEPRAPQVRREFNGNALENIRRRENDPSPPPDVS